MIVQTRAFLSLAEWFEVFGFHPLHSFQLGHDTLMPITSACNALVYQTNWQNANAAGRDQINDAIRIAETMIKRELGYSVAPVFECDDLQFPMHLDFTQQRYRAEDSRGRYLPFLVEQGMVRAMGKESLTHLAQPVVQFLDLDLDGINETFRVTAPVPVGVTDPNEICIYFTDTDRFDKTLDADTWRIEPVAVSITGGVATITGSVGVIVRPVLYRALTAKMLDVTAPATFAGLLDVYRRCVDTTSQGEFIWEARPPQCGFCPPSSDPAAYAALPARFNVRDAQIGEIAGDTVIANGDGSFAYTLWCSNFQPQKMRVNYFAGATTEGRSMQHHLRVMVARLAAAELSKPICGCTQANRELERWQIDLAEQPASPGSTWQIAPDVLSNPFGTRAGHVYAYRQAQMFKMLRGLIN